jgi:dCMP deaminase
MTDKDYLRETYKVALQSTDKRTQNGAILVNANGDILCSGANHFPKNVEPKNDRFDAPLKYIYTEHAERNSIFAACRQGIKTQDLSMYCCWAACQDCARAIIQSGIKYLVVHYNPLEEIRFGKKVSDMWIDSIKHSMQMFGESGVEVRWIDEQLFNNNDLKFLFNGDLVTP